jgi:hypothetical protein
MGLDQRGLTLIEAVVATAVVMVVVVAASNAVGVVHGATARADGRGAAEAAAAAEVEDLRSLPFAAGPAAQSATDLVSSVFPHADILRNSPNAAFSPEPRAGCPAGTFFTARSLAGGRMTVAATFVFGTIAGWAPVPGSRLAGYDALRSGELPSSALLVRVSVTWRAGADAGVVERSAILSGAPDGPCRIAGPAGAGPA